MRELVFDIETVPDENLSIDLRPEAPLGNLKDPAKIKVKVKEWEAGGQIKKMSVSPFMCQIVSIQAWSSEDGYIDAKSHNESDMLEFIHHVIYDHDVIIGHNIIGFDLQIIKARAMINEVEIAQRSINLKKYSNFPIYDTMQVLAGWDKDKWKGLDWWCKRLGLPSKTNHGSNVFKMWKEGKRIEIDEYCRDDVKATKELYDRIKSYYK